jgi:hypothetical protein
MTTRQKIELLIYGLVIVLSVGVLALATLSSSFELDTRVVYQGF